MMKLRRLILLVPFVATACGGGPSKSDIEAALNQPIK